jgi:hypothetical protein
VWFWILIALGGVILLGCLSFCALSVLPALLATETATPTPSPTPAATSTPTATPTPSPTPTPAVSLQVGMLLYSEDFSELSDAWSQGVVGEGEYGLEDAKYSIKVNKSQYVVWEGLGDEFGDFAAQVETTLVEGDKFNASGLMFRFQDKENYYMLSVNGNLKYHVGKEIGGEWRDVIDWREHEALLPMGQPNLIRLVGHGNTFTLYINGELADEFTDTDLDSGDLAIHVVVYDQEPARALFDNLEVWEVEVR